MKTRVLLAALVVLLLPVVSRAQGLGGDYIRYYPPAGAGATWDGGAFSSAATGPTGCAAGSIAYSFSVDTGGGLCANGANSFSLHGGNPAGAEAYANFTTTQWQIVYRDAGANTTGITIGDNTLQGNWEGGAASNLAFEPDSTGFAVWTAAKTKPTARTIAAGTGISVANGDGQLGNPTITATLYTTVDDEDTPLTQRATLNFEGAGVTCADDTDQTTCTIPGGGSSLPVADTTSIAEGSSDNTKEVRFEVDGLTTGTVRVLTVPDSDGTIITSSTTNTITSLGTVTSGTLSSVTISGFTASRVLSSDGSGNAQADTVTTAQLGLLSAQTADDRVPVSDSSSAATWRALPNGAVSYATASNTFSQATLANVASSTSAELRGVLSDEYGAGIALFLDGSGNLDLGGTRTAFGSLAVISAQTGTASTTAAQSGYVITNTGDADGSTNNLLNDPTAGVNYSFAVTAAQTMTIAPAAGETLYLNAASCANISSATVGAAASVVAASGGSGAIWIASGSGFTCN